MQVYNVHVSKVRLPIVLESEFISTYTLCWYMCTGINSLEGVVMLASTNRVDILDQALLRPGRFDRQISIDLPTLPERRAIFEVYLRKVLLERPVEGYSSRLAALTPGFSGKDLWHQ